MKTPMEKIEAMLTANKKPSYSDLEAALAQCLQERNAFFHASSEITAWMSKVAFARIQKDEKALNQTVDAFIAKAVVPHLPADVAINTPNGMVH